MEETVWSSVANTELLLVIFCLRLKPDPAVTMGATILFPAAANNNSLAWIVDAVGPTVHVVGPKPGFAAVAV